MDTLPIDETAVVAVALGWAGGDPLPLIASLLDRTPTPFGLH